MMALPHTQYVIAEASTPVTSAVNNSQVKTVSLTFTRRTTWLPLSDGVLQLLFCFSCIADTLCHLRRTVGAGWEAGERPVHRSTGSPRPAGAARCQSADHHAVHHHHHHQWDGGQWSSYYQTLTLSHTWRSAPLFTEGGQINYFKRANRFIFISLKSKK